MRLEPGNVVVVDQVAPPREGPKPQNIPLTILYEDDAIVVVDKRAYLFTFLDFREGEGVPNEDWAQAMFDAFAATITLDPQAAGGSPSPSPS